MKGHVHVIGAGGIGLSALARYYKHQGYTVSGSDTAESDLIRKLRSEGMDIAIGHNVRNLPEHTTLVVYSEAIVTKPDLPAEDQIYTNPELRVALEQGIQHISYPEALGNIFNTKKGIAIAGSHGKSTTTALVATMLAHSSVGGSAIVGTQVPTLNESNFHAEDADYFVVEACEYKRSFLHYRPYITVITNIDLDHLDYYRDLDDYLSAFQSLVNQTSGYVIVSYDDRNSHLLDIPPEKKIVVGALDVDGRPIIEYNAMIEDRDTEKISFEARTMVIPEFSLVVPGKHIQHDAHLAYTVGRLVGLEEREVVSQLIRYRGAWRRMEIIRTTASGNILMSDYGHHPTEIRLTLEAIRSHHPHRELCVVFQPHQYSRTREFLPEFATAFTHADRVIVPDIYFSRDSEIDVERMTPEHFVREIGQHHPHVEYGGGLTKTGELLQMYNQQKSHAIILLLGAGNVDMLRDKVF